MKNKETVLSVLTVANALDLASMVAREVLGVSVAGCLYESDLSVATMHSVSLATLKPAILGMKEKTNA